MLTTGDQLRDFRAIIKRHNFFVMVLALSWVKKSILKYTWLYWDVIYLIVIDVHRRKSTHSFHLLIAK